MTPEAALHHARCLLADGTGVDPDTAVAIIAGLLAAKELEREVLLAFFRRNVHSSHYIRIEKNIPKAL